MWSVQRSTHTGRIMVFHGGDFMESFLTYEEALDYIKTWNRNHGLGGYDLTF